MHKRYFFPIASSFGRFPRKKKKKTQSRLRLGRSVPTTLFPHSGGGRTTTTTTLRKELALSHAIAFLHLRSKRGREEGGL